MIKAEKESFLKSFSVFFFSLSILSAIVFYIYYKQLKSDLNEKIYNEMRICSYDLTCSEFSFDFVPLELTKLYQLEHNIQEVFALFSLPKNDKYALKLIFSQTDYLRLVKEIEYSLLVYYLWTLLIMALLSTLFSFYALYPLRKALHLTQEFSRDILHDLNTPLSALRLNVRLLHPIPDDEKKVRRIERSIDTIVSLGNNLQSYLEHHEYNREKIDMKILLQEQMLIYEKLYPSLNFSLTGETFFVTTYKDALVRIFDNLLSNAAKYNRPDGTVRITIELENRRVKIKDSGKGIQKPQKIFERFYKEQERGLGIGLDIVKKFCDELRISIQVESSLDEGSVFSLDFNKVTTI